MKEKYLCLIVLLFFIACSSSDEELPKTEQTKTFDKSYYLSFKDNLEKDLYKIGDKIRENGTFFSDTKQVRQIMEEVYGSNSLALNNFVKVTAPEEIASKLKMEMAVEKGQGKSDCVTPSLYVKIQEINNLLDKSNSAAEYVEVLESLFNETYDGNLSTDEKIIILDLIVSQQVSADFINNNPELFLMKEPSLVKSSKTNWDYWGKCLTAAAGTASINVVNIRHTQSGNIIGAYSSKAINCKAGFGHPKQPGGGSGPALSHKDDVGPEMEPERAPCKTCGRINVDICSEVEDLQ